ncbi:unnamed protein product [Bathycoccus prasinos]
MSSTLLVAAPTLRTQASSPSSKNNKEAAQRFFSSSAFSRNDEKRRLRTSLLCASSSSSADDDETSSSKSSSALPPGTSMDALDAVMMSPETETTTKTTKPGTKTFSEDVLAVCSKGYDFALQSLDKKLDLAIKLDPATGELLSDDNEQSVNLRQQKGLEEEKFAIDVLECLASFSSSSSSNGGGEENKQRIRAFARGQQVPKRSYALAELKLNDIDPSKLLAPTENTITEIKKKLGVAVGALVIVGAIVTSGEDVGAAPFQAIKTFVFLSFLLAYDAVALNAGAQNLVLDFVANLTSEEYKTRLRRHEAGHFLVAYLTGVLPKGYTLSSLDAFKRFGRLNVQAGTLFCDGQFQNEVKRGKITSTSVGRFACVALAGVCAEYAKYGNSEGGAADIQQLDQLFNALQFSQKKSDDEVRWATLNTMAIVRRHEGLVDELARMMGTGESTAKLISIIEARLANVAEKDI